MGPGNATSNLQNAVSSGSAALNPVRRRVQRAVDRLFNRARYDADETVAAFAARLKDAVDLDAVKPTWRARCSRPWNPPVYRCGSAAARPAAPIVGGKRWRDSPVNMAHQTRI
jgi:hypothetical protein